MGQWIRTGLLDHNINASKYHDYAKYGPAQVDTAAHRQLSREAAEQGIVLLRNEAVDSLAKGMVGEQAKSPVL